MLLLPFHLLLLPVARPSPSIFSFLVILLSSFDDETGLGCLCPEPYCRVENAQADYCLILILVFPPHPFPLPSHLPSLRTTLPVGGSPWACQSGESGHLGPAQIVEINDAIESFTPQTMPPSRFISSCTQCAGGVGSLLSRVRSRLTSHCWNTRKSWRHCSCSGCHHSRSSHDSRFGSPPSIGRTPRWKTRTASWESSLPNLDSKGPSRAMKPG